MIGSSERGVSAAVGVVLLVGMAVVLSAVLGSLVLNLSNPNAPPQAAYSIQQQPLGGGDYAVEMQIITVVRAEWISIQGPSGTTLGSSSGDSIDHDGDGEVRNDAAMPGEFLRVEGLSPGDRVVIRASQEGSVTVLGSFTVR